MQIQIDGMEFEDGEYIDGDDIDGTPTNEDDVFFGMAGGVNDLNA